MSPFQGGRTYERHVGFLISKELDKARERGYTDNAIIGNLVISLGGI